MDGGWDFAGQPPAASGSALTLVEGSTFCVADSSGVINPTASMGLFVRDTRIVSGWSLHLHSDGLEALTSQTLEPFEAMFIARRIPSAGESNTSLLISQHRYIGEGMHEDIRVHNLSHFPNQCVLTLRVEADFADLFEVKSGRGNTSISVMSTTSADALIFDVVGPDRRRGTRIMATGNPVRLPGELFWTLNLEPGEEWSACVEVQPIVDDEYLTPRHSCGSEGSSLPTARMQQWRANRLLVTTPNRGFARTIEKSLEDLASLRVYDPQHPDRAVVAAGAPWFMTLFGRDSLFSAWMILPFNHSLALGTLQSLADSQGTTVDPLTEEQPGRILHEVRFGMQSELALGGGKIYYGTADATPLFVMLTAELARWGVAHESIEALLPNVDRALAWISEYGDTNGDGFVEYHQMTPDGLANQGWKDSWDGINFADGQLPQAPIALCEVQAYVYGAYQARAELALRFGDAAAAEHWREKAADFKEKFNQRFWLPQRGWYAVGLDADGLPIDALASNMGHALWTGIVADEHAAQVAQHLVSPRMFTGWGIRTLADNMGAYNPVSYHNGSVWPHDSAIAAAGLMRYGFVEEAATIAGGLFEAAQAFDGRLPELFCGFDRSQYPFPVPYPTACSPQAWAAASPILLLRSLLRLDPDIPNSEVRLQPVVPKMLLPLTVGNIMLGHGRITINVDESTCQVSGLGDLKIAPPVAHNAPSLSRPVVAKT